MNLPKNLKALAEIEAKRDPVAQLWELNWLFLELLYRLKPYAANPDASASSTMDQVSKLPYVFRSPDDVKVALHVSQVVAEPDRCPDDEVIWWAVDSLKAAVEDLLEHLPPELKRQITKRPGSRHGRWHAATRRLVLSGCLACIVTGLVKLTPSLKGIDREPPPKRAPIVQSIEKPPPPPFVVREHYQHDGWRKPIENGLYWLAQHQDADGSWDADGFDNHCPKGDRCSGPAGWQAHGSGDRRRREHAPGVEADAGLTGLVLAAFANTTKKRWGVPYRANMRAAAQYLVANQREDGYLGGNAANEARMYCHAFATYGLATANDDKHIGHPYKGFDLPSAIRKGMNYIDQTMFCEGRRSPGEDSDAYLSVVACQLLALSAAVEADVGVPDQLIERWRPSLKQTLSRRNILASQRLWPPSSDATPSMAALALFCNRYVSLRTTIPASAEPIQLLRSHSPERSPRDLHYLFFGTVAMGWYGRSDWGSWYASLTNALVAEQHVRWHAAGSWDPNGRWGAYGGRIFSTVVAVLCLQRAQCLDYWNHPAEWEDRLRREAVKHRRGLL